MKDTLRGRCLKYFHIRAAKVSFQSVVDHYKNRDSNNIFEVIDGIEYRETWEVVEKFPGYSVSTFGRVNNIKKNMMVGQSCDKDGYLRVELGKGNPVRVNRLVATAFLKNSKNYPIVMHLNDVVTDNRIINLKWGTETDNTQDALSKGRIKRGLLSPVNKPVIQLSMSGEFIKEWASASQAYNELNINNKNISSCCYGKKTHAGGFKWAFKVDNYEGEGI